MYLPSAILRVDSLCARDGAQAQMMDDNDYEPLAPPRGCARQEMVGTQFNAWAAACSGAVYIDDAAE